MLITVVKTKKYRLTWKHDQFVVAKAKELGSAIPTLTPAERFKAARALCTGKYTGVTTCIISTLKEGDVEPVVVATGEAHCSKKDVYQRERGRRISLGRAVQNLVVDLETAGVIKGGEELEGEIKSVLQQYAARKGVKPVVKTVEDKKVA